MRGGRKPLLGIVDIFLIIIILLNILDFLEVIPPELDYIKKIISWTLLGYLLYKASPTKVMLGHASRHFDIVLIVAYFLMNFNLLVSYAKTSYEMTLLPGASKSLQPFFMFILDNHALFEVAGFSFGIATLFVFAIFAACRLPIGKKSIMGVLHEEGEASRNPKIVLSRLLMLVIVLLGFFLFVFNMVMGWLAIAIDATLLLIALLFYTLLYARHKVTVHRFLDKVGNIGSSFYSSFIDHFRYKESFLLGISGLLVLHLLTDVGNFLVPYLTGLFDPLYFGNLGPGHDHVWSILAGDLARSGSLLTSFSVIVVFLANIIGYIFLFISPAIMWYFLYHRRVPKLSKSLLVLFFTVLPASVLAPLFVITRLDTTNIYGVNVLTSSVFSSIVSPETVVAVMAVFLVMAVVFAEHQRTLRELVQGWIGVSVVFFGLYTYYYFIDVATYYQDLVMFLFKTGNFWFAAVFFVFQALTILFYVGGFGLFLYELVHRPKHEKS